MLFLFNLVKVINLQYTLSRINSKRAIPRPVTVNLVKTKEKFLNTRQRKISQITQRNKNH